MAPAPRFRTIQVRPKDLWALPGQPERAVSWHSGFRGGVVTAGTLVADDGETPVGSIFVIDAKDRATVDGFVRTDPYCVNSVWDKVQIHGYNKKRGTPISSRWTG